MYHRKLIALIVLNLVLLAGVICLYATPKAYAYQQIDLPRHATQQTFGDAPMNIEMFTGKMRGYKDNNTVYFMDMNTGLMIGYRLMNQKKLEVVTEANIAADFKRLGD